ncbi:hypothetical protein [Pseudonocardia sp. TRM90224]|nr:hypothetical protein [Pseudonocardia sp. TRM90224]
MEFTHKTPAVKRRSWLNLVERRFGELTTKEIQGSTYRGARAI